MIHKFEIDGYRLVLDVNSGTLHQLDESAYELIDFAGESMGESLPETARQALGGSFSPAELEEAWHELYLLFCDGKLFSPDYFRKYSNLCNEAPIKSMCLNIAHDCNLRCRYCFASAGGFGGNRKLMPFEVGKAALDFLFEKSGPRRNLEVDFFGGEPLMNFDVVKELVAYARGREKALNKNVRFTITTNGLLLDEEKISFINREMENVVLSIDGRKKVNDSMRLMPDGEGSYDAILPGIKELVSSRAGKDYYVRGTFTRYNLDFSEDALHLAEEGFSQISIEPAVCSPDVPYSLREEDLPYIFSEYEKLAREILRRNKEGRGFNFFHFMLDLEEGPCLIKLLKGCGCGVEYVAVTPDGDIYPCHQFVGQDAYIMGNVLKGGINNMRLRHTFGQANILSKEGCSECWARFFCGGGCSANNSMYCGKITKPFDITCRIEKKRLECALMLKAAQSQVS